ncbi:MAG: DUF3135 domain-containing protein [Gammaproteobacteria bacterium]|nr:DUF3135 domain-containing protein [Gammaproteobacteria bacterium]
MKTATEFDFDRWMALAKQDPEAFEQQRVEFLQKFIDGLPERAKQRLQRVQWRVDMERKRCKNPMESTVRIYDMMWGSLSQTHDELCNLVAMVDPESEFARIVPTPPKAKVLPFVASTGTEN